MLILGLWLSLGALVSLTLGAMITRAKGPHPAGAGPGLGARPAPGPIYRSADDYLCVSTDEWSLAAQRVAMDALYSTGPVLVHRVSSRRQGTDS